MRLHPVDGQERLYDGALLYAKVNLRGVYFQARSAISFSNWFWCHRKDTM
jgi:hypothetical protein